MKRKKSIILEDEPAAIEVLKNYIAKIEEIELVGSFRNPLDALGFLREQKVDLIFLDINLPDINGLQFLNKLSYKPHVIITTAYEKFAIDGYIYEVIDFLLKPITFDRFLSAVEKALKRDLTKKVESSEDTHIVYLKSGTENHKISINDIFYLEKDGHYVRFTLNERVILSRLNMKELFNILPSNRFIQIHKSYVVNKKYIDVIKSDKVVVAGKEIPIGTIFKKEVLSLLED